MSPTPDMSAALREVLEALRRHLLWQAEAGGQALLVARPAGESRSLRAALRPAAEPAAAAARPLAPPTAAAPARTGSVPPAPPAAAPPPGAPPAPLARPGVPRVGAAAALAARPSTPSPGAPATVAAPARPPTAPLLQRPPAAGALFDVSPPAVALPGVVDGQRPTLDEVRRALGDCRRCKLCTGRKNIVFGTGSPRAELVFVGEGPGENEDVQGVPFVGKAGELLTKMIEAMGFSRDDVYICNVVKCRPPGNRNPEPDEIEACEPFLRAQLFALQPKAIVALGKFAAQTLLRDSTPITRLRGSWREYQGVPLMPTFHPAYLLRSPGDKRLAWSDLQQVMRHFGKASPARG